MLRRFAIAVYNYPILTKTIKLPTMSFFPYTFVLYDTTKKIQLGRWGNHDDNKTIIKTDYNNVDHCGPCGLGKIKNIK